MLNKQQLEAVHTINGPLLILAGAGTGKTTVLVERIGEMLNQRISPFNILAITFTNKAANEMKERIAKKVGDEMSKKLWASTFHSMCVRILRAHSRDTGKIRPGFTIYDTDDSLKVINNIIAEMGLDKKEVVPKSILSAISSLKNEMIDYDTYAQNKPSNIYIDWNEATKLINKLVRKEDKFLFKEIYKRYQEALSRYNAVDFDDIMLHTVNLFIDNPDILESYQNRFKYIMIDEYQDTNHTQYILVKLLARKYKNLGVVGDDKQAIYSFRGAKIRNILNFNKDYPEAKVILLEENYRSSNIILEAANQVIARNEKQYKMTLFTSKTDGEKIRNATLENDLQEADYVLNEIEDLISSKKYNYQDITILYRTNSITRAFEQAFIRAGIPYKVVGGQRFFDRKEIKDMVAYLKSIQNLDDVVSFQRAINLPKRGVGPKALQDILVHSNRYGLEYTLRHIDEIQLTKKAKEGVLEYIALVDNIRKVAESLPVNKVMEKLLEDSGIMTAISIAKEDSDKKKERKQNTWQLVNMAEELTYKGEISSLEDFLEQISLYSDTDEIDEDSAVKLMTVHASKGLEFPVVFICGLEEKIFPHDRSVKEGNLEEERRLFYVALTRAKELLYLTNVIERRLFGRPEFYEYSRFLEEFSFDLLKTD